MPDVLSIDPHDLDDHMLDVQDQMARLKIEDVLDSARESQRVACLDNHGWMAYSVVLPKGRDVDESRFIAMPLPLAQTCDPESGLHMHLRAMAVQAAVAEGQFPLVMFPNMKEGQPAYQLDDRELLLLSNGNFTPLTYRMSAVVKQDGLLHKCVKAMIVGWSQGATIGPALAHDVDTDRALYGDPPNVVDRTPEELKKDFTKGGFANLNKPIKDSALPALTELQNAPRHLPWATRPAQLAGFIRFQKATKLPHNAALIEGMGVNRFGLDLVNSLYSADRHAMVVRGQTSAITPPFSDDMFFPGARNNPDWVESKLDQVTFAEILGYGHGAGDNIIGGLGRAARLAFDLSDAA